MSLLGCERDRTSTHLSELLKTSVSFHWGKDQDRSFTDLKHALTHAPMLSLRNFKDAFLLQTAASTSVIGAVSMQTDETGKRHVKVFLVEFYSRQIKKNSFTHLKIIAVVWAPQHLRDIIMGYSITAHTGLACCNHGNFQRQKFIWPTRPLVPSNTNVQA